MLATVVGVLAPPDTTVPIAATLSSGNLPHAWAAGIALVLALVSAAALVELARMLGRVQEHALFALAATRHFRRFVGLLALAAALRVVLPAFATIAMAWQAGHHPAYLTLDGDDLLSLLLTAVFFLVARLFDEAARLEDDSRSIV